MPVAEAPLLEVRGVSKRFAGVKAVDRATFDVAPRLSVAVARLSAFPGCADTIISAR